ncbi:MAG: NF038143 family protein [Desulfohalobiaceae bacterium]
MNSRLDRNYRVILDREQRFAKSVAFESVDRPELTAWLIIAPLYIIYWLYQARKYKRSIEDFHRNFLVHKKWALEGAYEMADQDTSAQELLQRFQSQAEHLANNPGLQQSVQKEIATLLQHYYRLLTATGNDYAELVRSAYPTQAEFQEFVDSILQAEKEESQAALEGMQGVDQESAAEVGNKMEAALSKLRNNEVQRIFAAA